MHDSDQEPAYNAALHEDGAVAVLSGPVLHVMRCVTTGTVLS